MNSIPKIYLKGDTSPYSSYGWPVYVEVVLNPDGTMTWVTIQDGVGKIVAEPQAVIVKEKIDDER